MKEFPSKLYGLKMLGKFALPHPDWRFVLSNQIVQLTPWTEAEYGWTVRTAINSVASAIGAERHLPFINKASWQDVKHFVKSSKQNSNLNLIYIIYPSWQFVSSGCILSVDNFIRIEAVQGSIAKLTEGKTNPDASITFQRFPPFLRTDETGALTIINQRLLRSFVRAFPLISMYDGNLEWALTSKDQLFFFQWDLLRNSPL